MPEPPTTIAVRVRPAVHRDAAAMRDLLEELGYPMSADEVHARLRVLTAEPATKLMVAEHEDRVVGIAVLHWFELLERPGSFSRLLALVVTDDHRGQGVGRQLVEACENIARKNGSLGLEVTSAPHREDADAFYQELGFVAGASRYYRKTFAAGKGATRGEPTSQVAGASPGPASLERTGIPEQEGERRD